LTLLFLIVATAVIVVLVVILIARHVESTRGDRIRARVQGRLGPVFSRFLETEDPAHLAEGLRPAFVRMNAAERAVAAVLITDVMREVGPAQTDQLRRALEVAGLVGLGERGTRRRSPWRRALACELLGKIGARRSVGALLERLEDRRPEVRIAAVRALGDVGSAEAVPALAEAFAARGVAPSNIVSEALRRIGGEAAGAFERGVSSPDAIVRVASCFGLAATAEGATDAVGRLTEVLWGDPQAQVRGAAAAALGLVGGERAPEALREATHDEDVHVRRSAVRSLGAFDDPTAGETLMRCVEDEDRETALRAGEALLALTRRPRAALHTRARVERSPAWAIEYARKVEEVSA